MRLRLAVVLGLILCLTGVVIQPSMGTSSGDVSLTVEASEGQVGVDVESDGDIDDVTIVAIREDPVEGPVVDGIGQADLSSKTNAAVTLDGLRANASLNITALDGSTSLPSTNAHAAFLNATGIDALAPLARELGRTPHANGTSTRSLPASTVAQEPVPTARSLVTDSGLVVVGYLSYGGNETHRTSDGPVQARVSTDGGRTFGSEIQISDETMRTTGNFNLVELAPDRVLFLVDVEDRDILFQGAVVDARTGEVLDRPTYRPAGPDAEYAYGLTPALAPVAPGTVLLASGDIEWTQGDGIPQPPTDAMTIWQLDGEGTMRQVQTLAGHDHDARRPQIAVSPTGHAVLVYTTFDPGGDDDRDGWHTAHVSRAPAIGAPFSTPRPIRALDQALPEDSDGAQGPQAVAISVTGTAHATFTNHPTGQNKVDGYHVRLPVANRSPTVHHVEEDVPPISEGDDAFGFHPTVGTRGDRVWILYGDGRDPVAVESTDDGRRFGPHYVLEPAATDEQYNPVSFEGPLTVLPDGRPLATVDHHVPNGTTHLSAITPFDPLRAGGLDSVRLDAPDPQPYSWTLGDPPQADWIGNATTDDQTDTATRANETSDVSQRSNDTNDTNETTKLPRQANATATNGTTPENVSSGNHSLDGSRAPNADQADLNGSSSGNDTRIETPTVGLALPLILASLAALVARPGPSSRDRR